VEDCEQGTTRWKTASKAAAVPTILPRRTDRGCSSKMRSAQSRQVARIGPLDTPLNSSWRETDTGSGGTVAGQARTSHALAASRARRTHAHRARAHGDHTPRAYTALHTRGGATQAHACCSPPEGEMQQERAHPAFGPRRRCPLAQRHTCMAMDGTGGRDIPTAPRPPRAPPCAYGERRAPAEHTTTRHTLACQSPLRAPNALSLVSPRSRDHDVAQRATAAARKARRCVVEIPWPQRVRRSRITLFEHRRRTRIRRRGSTEARAAPPSTTTGTGSHGRRMIARWAPPAYGGRRRTAVAHAQNLAIGAAVISAGTTAY
jgi:hypothetical protein